MIRLSDAREIILLARSVGIEPIVDGGWGVDALIGCLATQARARRNIRADGSLACRFRSGSTTGSASAR